MTGRPACRACGPAGTLPALLAWNRDSLLGVLIPESDGTTIAALWLILAPGKLAFAARQAAVLPRGEHLSWVGQSRRPGN